MLMNEALPYDHAIAYLETSGTQWINTGFSHRTRNTELRMRFQWVGSDAGLFESFFAYMKDGAIFPRSGFHKYNGKWMFGTNATGVTEVNVDGSVHDVFITGDASAQEEQTYLDGRWIGTLTTVSDGLVGNYIPFFIGCRNRNGSVDNPASVRVMSVSYKTFSEAQHLVVTAEIDMIPVRVGSVGYMYDKVSKTLFGNAGSGSFILGNDI